MDDKRPPNWRAELKTLFYEYAAMIMHEVFDEIRENLDSGEVRGMVPPELERARREVFGDPEDRDEDFPEFDD